MSARYLTLSITPELAGAEVNTLLRRTLGLSGTVLRRIKWLEDGITLDGARVNVRVRAKEGQTLAVRLTDPELTSGVAPIPGPLDIVYEDWDLIVLNKAPGVLVHPGHGHFDDTLGNFLMYHYKTAGEEADFHPVHRLDKGTSGLLVAAKHPHAQERLKLQLHTGAFRRVYLAVCDGVPPAPSGMINAPIGQTEGSLMAREVRPDGQARPHPLPGAARLRPPHPGGAGAGDRAHPSNPRPHGPPGLPPHRGLPVRDRKPGAHRPPRPPLRAAGADPPHHRHAAALCRPPARRPGGADSKGEYLMKKLRFFSFLALALLVILWTAGRVFFTLPDWAVRVNGVIMVITMALLVFSSIRLLLQNHPS